MADTPAKQTAQAAPTVAAQPVEHALTLAGRHRPIVVEVKGKKRKKRKYSKGLKNIQIGSRKLTRAGSKFSSAISDGFRKFRRKSDKSSRKKRDGVLRDLLRNSASGVGTTLRKSNKVPVLLAKMVSKRASRKGVRALGRMMRGFMR